MSTLSTHVLDTSIGQPAARVPVVLEQEGVIIHSGSTDNDGRVATLRSRIDPLGEGVYTLRFGVAEYFAVTGRECFYPDVTIRFRIGSSAEHYHVPLLISPFGYATYRGS